MSYVGIKKSYVGIIKQQNNTTPAVASNISPPPESGNTQIGVGNVFTTVDGKKRNLFELDEEGKRVYNPTQIGIGLAGRAAGAGLGAWNAARTLSESQGGDMISDLGRAGIAGQQTMNLGTAATNVAMDAPGKIANMPKTIRDYTTAGTTSGFEKPALMPDKQMSYPSQTEDFVSTLTKPESMRAPVPAKAPNPVKVVDSNKLTDRELLDNIDPERMERAKTLRGQ
jgi:hypothetical protein